MHEWTAFNNDGYTYYSLIPIADVLPSGLRVRKVKRYKRRQKRKTEKGEIWIHGLVVTDKPMDLYEMWKYSLTGTKQLYDTATKILKTEE